MPPFFIVGLETRSLHDSFKQLPVRTGCCAYFAAMKAGERIEAIELRPEVQRAFVVANATSGKTRLLRSGRVVKRRPFGATRSQSNVDRAAARMRGSAGYPCAVIVIVIPSSIRKSCLTSAEGARRPTLMKSVNGIR